MDPCRILQSSPNLDHYCLIVSDVLYFERVLRICILELEFQRAEYMLGSELTFFPQQIEHLVQR